jgi:hypothetical protein
MSNLPQEILALIVLPIPIYNIRYALLNLSYISKGFRNNIVSLYNSKYYWYLRFRHNLCAEAEYNWCKNWILLKQYPDIFWYRPVLKKIVMNNDYYTAKLILKANLIPEKQCYNSVTRISIKNGYQDIAEHFIGDAKVIQSNDMLVIACSKGNIPIINLLLDNPNIDHKYKDNMAMRKAILHKQTKVVDILLSDMRITPYYDFDDFLILASEGTGLTSTKIVNMLLLYGADCSTYEYKAIRMAARVENQKTIKLLMQHKKHPFNILKYIFKYGVKNNMPKVVKLMLKTFKSDDVVNYYEYIKYATRENYDDVVKVFYEHPLTKHIFSDNLSYSEIIKLGLV